MRLVDDADVEGEGQQNYRDGDGDSKYPQFLVTPHLQTGEGNKSMQECLGA